MKAGKKLLKQSKMKKEKKMNEISKLLGFLIIKHEELVAKAIKSNE